MLLVFLHQTRLPGLASRQNMMTDQKKAVIGNSFLHVQFFVFLKSTDTLKRNGDLLTLGDFFKNLPKQHIFPSETR